MEDEKFSLIKKEISDAEEDGVLFFVGVEGDVCYSVFHDRFLSIVCGTAAAGW